MKKGLFDRRIPTIFALVIVVVIIIISTVLVQSGVFYIGKAAPDTQPQQLLISNITDSSFTVAFSTLGQVEAVASLTESQTGNTLVLDDRDKKNGISNKYYSHHITLPNLKANTRYNFKLIVGGKEYFDPSYLAQTGPLISINPPAQNPLFGKVLLSDGSLGSDTLISAKTSESQVITSITDSKGEFILPTNSLRNLNNTSYITLDNNMQITLQFSRQSMKSTVATTFNVAQNLPSVTLEEQYAFIQSTDEMPTEGSNLTITSNQTVKDTVTIKRPKPNEEFIDQRPTFTGTSFPNSNIEILVPGLIQQQILTKADGSWQFQPVNNLPSGNHILTVNVKDANGKEITVSSNFSVFSVGSQIADSTGQSFVRVASLTSTPTPIPPTPTKKPVPTPTLTPTPTKIITPTSTVVTPTSAASPTITPTLTLTLTPSATPTALPTINYTPTNTPTISPPGALENTALLTGFSVILIVSGIILLFAL